MSRSSLLTGVVQSRIPQIARRVRNRMNELGLNESQLAARCNNLVDQSKAKVNVPSMSRERIAKILMNCKLRPEKSAARIISHHELTLLSRALRVSPEWLSGQTETDDPILWDPFAHPERLEHILHLMNECEGKSTDVLSWAESLMCSFETPAFMHEHNSIIFSELDLLGMTKERKRIVRIYDNIGDIRRRRLLDPSRREGKVFTQVILLSDLEKIAFGIDHYGRISNKTRSACIKRVRKVISNSLLGLRLIVVRDEEVDDLKRALRDYDSIGVFGDQMVLWRHHSGRMAWSQLARHIEPYRKLLIKMESRANYREPADVIRLLDELAVAAARG